jgi:hypothetical protein
VGRLLKVGGEGAGAGAGATGAALFLRLLRGWSSSGFLADLPLIFALARGVAAYYTFIDPSEMRCFNQVLLYAKRYGTLQQCCGSGIRCLFDPKIRDPGWGKNPNPG